MNRDAALARIAGEEFDILIVGGGATGLGCAVDAASRGYRTALIEGSDFANATSSRSTKLIHGGVRYLQQGNVALVHEALHERSRLLRNAPHLVQPLAFVLPMRAWWEPAYYGTGLLLYDLLARSKDVPRTRIADGRETAALFPSLQPKAARRAAIYWDAHFDDARLAIALAQTATNCGAAVVNYVRVDRFLYRGGRVAGVGATDVESDSRYEIRAKAVVNATGIFADRLRLLDRNDAAPLLAFSRGSHIVVSREALPIAQTGMLIPRTSDGRVLFVVPWHGSALIGTTDIAAAYAEANPAPAESEIQYLIGTTNRYLSQPITRSDVRTAFAGLRPLVNRASAQTARLSREHVIDVSPSALLTIAGGKWTTYRKMAEDAIDKAAGLANLPNSQCRTHDLKLHDSPSVPTVAYAIEHEMARRLEDTLGRRRRTLFVDAQAARVDAPATARTLQEMLGRDAAWAEREVQEFDAVAAGYGSLAAGELKP